MKEWENTQVNQAKHNTDWNMKPVRRKKKFKIHQLALLTVEGKVDKGKHQELLEGMKEDVPQNEDSK